MYDSSWSCNFRTVKQLPNISRRLILELPELFFGRFLLKHYEKHMLHKKIKASWRGRVLRAAIIHCKREQRVRKLQQRRLLEHCLQVVAVGRAQVVEPGGDEEGEGGGPGGSWEIALRTFHHASAQILAANNRGKKNRGF